MPSLLFVGDSHGKAEEAIKFYTSVFKDSKIGAMMHYGPGQQPGKEGTVMFADLKLFDTWFAAMDGAGEHNFNFNGSICNKYELRSTKYLIRIRFFLCKAYEEVACKNRMSFS